MEPTTLQELQKVNLTQYEKAEMLEAARWGKDFDWQEIERLSDFLSCYEADPGQIIMKEGDREAFLCIIAKGKVDIFKEGNNRQQKKLITLGTGKSLGEMSLVDGQPRSATVTSASPSTLFVMTKKQFSDLINRDPRIGIKLLLKITQMMSNVLRKTTGNLIDLMDRV